MTVNKKVFRSESTSEQQEKQTRTQNIPSQIQQYVEVILFQIKKIEDYNIQASTFKEKQELRSPKISIWLKVSAKNAELFISVHYFH